MAGLAFHFVISWIFAPGPKMLERVVKPIFRLLREFDGGYFKVLPISERIRKQELVPFENEIQLREPSLVLEQMFSSAIASLLFDANFILESITSASRNFLEAQGATYVRVSYPSNEIICGTHVVSN